MVVNDLGGNTTGSGSSSSAAAGALAFKSAAKHAWKRVSQKGVLQAFRLAGLLGTKRATVLVFGCKKSAYTHSKKGIP